jgi:hypothetical protein
VLIADHVFVHVASLAAFMVDGGIIASGAHGVVTSTAAGH